MMHLHTHASCYTFVMLTKWEVVVDAVSRAVMSSACCNIFVGHIDDSALPTFYSAHRVRYGQAFQSLLVGAARRCQGETDASVSNCGFDLRSRF